MKHFLVSSLLLLSATTYSASIDISIYGQAKTLYSQEDKDTFIKEFTDVSAKIDVSASQAGQTRSFSNETPFSRDKSTGLKSITLLKNDQAQFIDKQTDEKGNISNIDSKIKVELHKKGLFGKLVGLKISSTTLESLYEAELEAQGLNILKGFTGSFDGFSVSTDVKFGEMDCEIQGGAMECLEDFTILVNASDDKE